MRVLITGVAGFIGSHLSERLLEMGIEVTGIDNFDAFYSKESKERNLKISLLNPLFNFYEFDITKAEDFSKLGRSRFDIIIHIAAKAGVRPSIQNPDLYMQTNILGSLHVLELMRKINCRNLVFASS